MMQTNYIEFLPTKEQLEQKDRYRIMLADVFIATFSRDRKPGHTEEAFKRQRRNYNKALKARLHGGPNSTVWLDTHTMRVM